MKSRSGSHVAPSSLALFSLLAAAALALGACAVEPNESEEGSAVAPLAQDEQQLTGDLTPQTEYTYWRCSTTNRHYPTRPFCQEECPTGTCRLTLVCLDDQGRQVPCS